jgi:hypothetical protein
MMKLIEARKVAEALLEQLRPACTRIEIKGSIARLKDEPGDIELLVIPDLTPVPRARAQFGKPIPPPYNTLLDKMVDEMRIQKTIDVYGDGPRYKTFWLNDAGIKVDLFINIPPSHWGVQAVIRTGPRDFGHWCVTNRKHGGALPDAYFVKHQVVWIKGEIDKHDIPGSQNQTIELLSPANHLPMPEEIDFLNLLELGWIEPKDRVARWTK